MLNQIKPQLIGEYDVTQIFSMSEDNVTEKEYNYNEQKPIVGKSKLVFSGEGLKRYSFPIKLHYSYCNPSKIIEKLEEKASNGEVFSYYQQSEYIGEYVICRIEKKVTTRYKSQILYAEITVDIIEYPVEEGEYTQKTNPNEHLFDNAVSISSAPAFDPVKPKIKQAAKSLFETLEARAFDYALGQAEELLEEVFE